MSAIAKTVMRKFYRKAEGQPERLPWYQQTPPPLLQKAVASMKGRGRALDVGSGAGVFTVWMARQGLDVTGIDLSDFGVGKARNAQAASGFRSKRWSKT